LLTDRQADKRRALHTVTSLEKVKGRHVGNDYGGPTLSETAGYVSAKVIIVLCKEATETV